MKQHILNLLKKRWTLPVATGVSGLGIGTGIGYICTKKQYDRIERQVRTLEEDHVRSEHEWRERSREINIQQQQISRITKELREQAEKMFESITTDKTLTLAPSGPVTYDAVYSMGEVVSIFDKADDEWDYKTEIENRDKSRPYIIHVDEYVSGEMDFDQSTLTWYEGDSILCDPHDVPIYSVEATVGELRFGHGSNDPNAVYVRNEQMHSEFEVLRYTGSYQEIVLGEKLDKEQEDQELKHSFSRKFRSD